MLFLACLCVDAAEWESPSRCSAGTGVTTTMMVMMMMMVLTHQTSERGR